VIFLQLRAVLALHGSYVLSKRVVFKMFTMCGSCCERASLTGLLGQISHASAAAGWVDRQSCLLSDCAGHSVGRLELDGWRSCV
jgi:hypothetical protein